MVIRRYAVGLGMCRRGSRRSGALEASCSHWDVWFVKVWRSGVWESCCGPGDVEVHEEMEARSC